MILVNSYEDTMDQHRFVLSMNHFCATTTVSTLAILKIFWLTKAPQKMALSLLCV